jgi:hypothetical protein
MLVGVVLAAACMQAKESLPAVRVCLSYQGGQSREAFRAKFVAGEIFKRIGVKLEWYVCADGAGEDIHIRVVADAPADLPDTAYAYARPYEGRTIEIFYNRMSARTHSYLGDIWGHVMAHEIGHILQGVARHSETGVMKAAWGASEKEEMSYRPMQFTPYDAALIHSGIRVRQSKTAGTLAAAGRRP